MGKVLEFKRTRCPKCDRLLTAGEEVEEWDSEQMCKICIEKDIDSIFIEEEDEDIFQEFLNNFDPDIA